MGSDNKEIIFTESEVKTLYELDSLAFGFLESETPEGQTKKSLLKKTVRYFEQLLVKKIDSLVEARSKDLEGVDNNSERQKIIRKYKEKYDTEIEPHYYLFLGHYQLLLEDFAAALSAYQQYETRNQEAWKDIPYLYGIGTCYFHFNSFSDTISYYQKVLYMDRNFSRANEIHIRLGYIYKIRSDYDNSVKHFRDALKENKPASIHHLEIRFHLAHLYEICGKHKNAQVAYEQLAKMESTPVRVKHQCLKQLGCLYLNQELTHQQQQHGKGTPSMQSQMESTQRLEIAICYLRQAIALDTSHGKTWYFLGRCQASQGHVYEAFISYRNSIDKTEGSADTWCSIGKLYQNQNQTMDALQAYMCAVQLDKKHMSAWINLGLLYESVTQFKDAFKCYQSAANVDRSNQLPEIIRERMAIMERSLNSLPDAFISKLNRVLPSLEEAWTLPIPAELTQRRQLQQQQQQQHQQQQQNEVANSTNGSLDSGQDTNVPLLNASNNNRKRKTESLPTMPSQQHQSRLGSTATNASAAVPSRAPVSGSGTPVDALVLSDLSELADMGELGREDNEDLVGDINIISEDFLSTLTSESVQISGCPAFDKLDEEFIEGAGGGNANVGGGSGSGSVGQTSGAGQVCDDAHMVDVLASWTTSEQAATVPRYM